MQGGPRSEGAEPLAVLHPDTRSEGAPHDAAKAQGAESNCQVARLNFREACTLARGPPPGGVAAKLELQRAAALTSRCAATRPATASAQQRPRLASRAAIAS